ncbi:MAG TPA: carboxypeptidase regulatory-like domain-containing protein [Pseudonocardiaceae bacterium]
MDLGLSEEDERLLAELATVLELADPVPDGMTARIQFALELDDLEFEVAQWQRDDRLVGVRGSAAPDTITFTVGDLTVMVSVTPGINGNRFDGWLVPGGPHTVEVRVHDHEPTTTSADDGGRFALEDVPKGITQIVVHLADRDGQRARTVVTPTIVL